MLKPENKLILWIAIFPVVLFSTTAACIAISGMRDHITKVDVAIVFGNKINTDGSPSKRLRARLDKTTYLYRKGYFPLVIVSGGVGKEGFSEALVMQQYLIQGGIPQADIWIDETGNTTQLTAKHSAALIRAGGLKSAVLISQFYHLPRARLAVRRAHIAPIDWAHADYFELRDIYSLMRESVAIYSYFLNGIQF